MRQPFNRIMLTGASGGIGAALARRLAAPGVSLLLTGRDAPRLAAAAEAARARGATVETARADIADAEAMARLVLGFDAEAPVDLLIANAGINGGASPEGEPESAADAMRLISVNLVGAINTVAPILPAMRARGRGHVAVLSSVAALCPLPDMPGYSASKAGLRAWALAQRAALKPDGVRVSVVTPGFVASPMADRYLGAQPFRISADRAADIIARGLARGRPSITPPWPMAVAGWLYAVTPHWLSDPFMAGFRCRIAPQ